MLATDTFPVTATVTVKITAQQIEDITVTAVDQRGGAVLYRLTDAQWDRQSGAQPRSIQIARVLIDGGSVAVIDAYGDGEAGNLTLTSLLAAIGSEASRRQMSVERFLDVHDDADDADGLMQIAAFGDWIYG
jgi:hypothetical protein